MIEDAEDEKIVELINKMNFVYRSKMKTTPASKFFLSELRLVVLVLKENTYLHIFWQ